MRKKLNDMRPNFHSVGGYDGMHLIYKALEATKGNTNGEALVNAMKGHVVRKPARTGHRSTATRATRPERLHAQGRARRTASSGTSSSQTHAGGEGSAAQVTSRGAARSEDVDGLRPAAST